MKGIVLCAVLFVSLAVNQSYGAAVDLSFLHDTNFPGNPGFNANINKYVQSTIDNAMASANAQAATGYTGSNVVIAPLVQSLPDGSSKITTPTVVTSTIGGRISQPRYPKIKPIKPPKYVKPVIKPRTPLWKPTPSLTTPVTTFVGDKERNIMTNMQNSELGGNVVINPIVQTITDDGKLITTTPSMINGKPILPGVPNPITTVVNGVQGEIIPSTTLTPTILPEVSVTGTTDLNGVQQGIIFSKIKPIKSPKFVKPVVKPRTPLRKPTPSLPTPVTTFVGDKERNIMTNMQNSNLGGNVVFNPIVQTITDDGKLITTTPSMINGKPILPGVPNPITTVVNGVQGEIIPSLTLTPTILPEVSVTGTTDVNGVQQGIMNNLKFENLGNNGNEHVIISPVVQSPGLKVNENGDVDFS